MNTAALCIMQLLCNWAVHGIQNIRTTKIHPHLIFMTLSELLKYTFCLLFKFSRIFFDLCMNASAVIQSRVINSVFKFKVGIIGTLEGQWAWSSL